VNQASGHNRLPIPRSSTESYQSRLPSTYAPNQFRRDNGRGFQAPFDTNTNFNYDHSFTQPAFGSESMAQRQFDRREEPPPKKQRRNPSFPDIDTRYVLGSHKSSSHGNGEDPTTPHSTSASFNDGYFSQYATQSRSNESPTSRTYVASQPRRQYPPVESNQYPTPESSRSYQGHVSNRLSMGCDISFGYSGTTDAQRHHYQSSAESLGSIPAPAAMHPPVQGTSRPSPTSDSRNWQGSFENSTAYSGYHSRNSSTNALPTGHLLPAPMNLQSRSSVENAMNPI
jgi:hypothetical protein